MTLRLARRLVVDRKVKHPRAVPHYFHKEMSPKLRRFVEQREGVEEVSRVARVAAAGLLELGKALAGERPSAGQAITGAGERARVALAAQSRHEADGEKRLALPGKVGEAIGAATKGALLDSILSSREETIAQLTHMMEGVMAREEREGKVVVVKNRAELLLASSDATEVSKAMVEASRRGEGVIDSASLTRLVESTLNAPAPAAERERSLEIYDELSKRCVKQDLGAYLSGVRACVRAKKGERALQIMSIAETELGPLAAHGLYHGVMHACATRPGTAPYTFETYERLRREGMFTPDTTTLNLLLTACTKLRDADRAEAFWNDFAAIEGFKPTRANYIELMKCRAASNLNTVKRKTKFHAFLFSESHHAYPPDPIRVDPEAHARFVEEKGDEAGMLVEALGGMTPDHEESAQEAYVSRTRSTASSEEEEEEEDDDYFALLEEEEEEDENEMDALDALLDFEESVGSEGGGEELERGHAVEVPALRPREGGASRTLAELEKEHEEEVMKRAEEERANAGRNAPERVQMRNITRVLELFEEMREKSEMAPDTVALNVVMKAFANAYRLQLAERCLELFPVFGCSPDAFTINTLVSMYARTRRLDRALEILESAGTEHGVDRIQTRTYGAIVVALARENRLDEAMRMVQRAVANDLSKSGGSVDLDDDDEEEEDGDDDEDEDEGKEATPAAANRKKTTTAVAHAYGEAPEGPFPVQEKHIRLLRIKAKAAERHDILRALPPDPNYFRSRELVGKLKSAINPNYRRRKIEATMRTKMRPGE